MAKVWRLRRVRSFLRLPILAAALAISVCLVPIATFAASNVERLQVAPSAVKQIEALEAIKKAQTPAQEKLDSRLYLAALHQRNDPSLEPLTDFRFMQPDKDGRVEVDIVLAGATGMKPVLQKLDETGGIVTSKHVGFLRISARVPLTSLEALAELPSVRRVRQRMPYYTNAINTSEGDATHGAATARPLFSTTGVGIKVGVISDGVDSLAALQASGDLPPVVDVLAGQAGSGDEGSAMLEIIHDLAPDADLAFATAVNGEAQFAQNILDLAAAGCDIIVDDIIYLDESPFQDGPVAQAVNTVTAAGVLYFSSAGNEGNADDLTSGTWEGDFVPNGTPAVLAGAGPVHDFGDGGQSILVESAFGNPPLLIWAEHYDLATGNASTDFDLYVMNGTLTTIFDASTDIQNGAGGDDFPIEFVGGGTFSGERLVVAQFAAGATSSVPMFNLIVFRGELDNALATGGATRGHSAAADAFSTAATPVANSFGATPNGPFPGLFTAANETESFSSDGPRRIILTAAGAEITPGNRTSTGGIVRQKPDITAADGVSCAAPGFSTFYGTSAAAPHAAAIAALMISAVPALTPADVRTHLLSSAIDIEAAGTDRDTGAGIVMTQAALEAAGALSIAYLDAGAAVPTQVIGDGDAFIENNEIFNLTIPLNNLGTAAATGISAVLTSSTPGVTFNNPSSAYPDIPGGGPANNTTPFTFTVGPAVPCGATIDFVLDVTYTGANSPQSFPFSFRTGEPGAPLTFSYTGPPVAIGDAADLSGSLPGAVAISSLLVAGLPGAIYDLDFRFDGSACTSSPGSATVGLDHTFVSDLHLTLRSPGGTTVLVANEPDGSGNNFCQTVLDDESGGPSIQTRPSATAPFTGTFTPNAPLSTLHGETGNGTWQFEVQDFFSGDTGNIRAYSLIITPAICDAPSLEANVFGTKTVAGTYAVGSNVIYTVTLTNTGGLAQADNGTDEFVDVLPANLTLVSAFASSGTAAANVGLNTVTWNGALAALDGSVTITITATVNNAPPGTIVSNQGTIQYDVEGDGSNESSRLTDDPAVGGAADPTTFTILGAEVTGTKTVSAGPYTVGGNVTYTITLTNSGNAASPDNAGDEFTDVLPTGLTLASAFATSGTAVANVGTNTVTWNGSIPGPGNVTITIDATIDADAAGTTIANQGSISYDGNNDGVNESSGVTDDPGAAGSSDATAIMVEGVAINDVLKSVSGSFRVGSTVTYTIIINNTGDAASGDNPGDELTDTLPASLTLVGATATSGTAVPNIGTNTVTWNGSVPAGGSVTITIEATVNDVPPGTVISNQATHSYDSTSDGTNDTAVLSDDPSTAAPDDATSFAVLIPIPALSIFGLMLLAMCITVVALKVLKG